MTIVVSPDGITGNILTVSVLCSPVLELKPIFQRLVTMLLIRSLHCHHNPHRRFHGPLHRTMGEQWLLKQFCLNPPVEHIQKPKLPKLYVRVETSTSYFIIPNQIVKYFLFIPSTFLLYLFEVAIKAIIISNNRLQMMKA